MANGRVQIGKSLIIPGNPADGVNHRQHLLLRVRRTILAAVGLLEVGLLTTIKRRRMTHSIAQTRGAAAGSTTTSGKRGRLGPVNGSADPVDGTADIETIHQKVRLEMRGVCFVRRSTWPHASDGDAGDGCLFCPPVKKGTGEASVYLPLQVVVFRLDF